jgi:hypothetical protein
MPRMKAICHVELDLRGIEGTIIEEDGDLPAVKGQKIGIGKLGGQLKVDDEGTRLCLHCRVVGVLGLEIDKTNRREGHGI